MRAKNKRAKRTRRDQASGSAVERKYGHGPRRQERLFAKCSAKRAQWDTQKGQRAVAAPGAQVEKRRSETLFPAGELPVEPPVRTCLFPTFFNKIRAVSAIAPTFLEYHKQFY